MHIQHPSTTTACRFCTKNMLAFEMGSCLHRNHKSPQVLWILIQKLTKERPFPLPLQLSFSESGRWYGTQHCVVQLQYPLALTPYACFLALPDTPSEYCESSFSCPNLTMDEDSGASYQDQEKNQQLTQYKILWKEIQGKDCCRAVKLLEGSRLQNV